MEEEPLPDFEALTIKQMEEYADRRGFNKARLNGKKRSGMLLGSKKQWLRRYKI